MKWREWRGRIVWGLRLLFAGVLFYFAYRIAVGDIEDLGVVVPTVALALLGLLVATVPGDDVRRILGRVENLSLGPFGIGLIRDAEAAAASSEVVFEGFGVEIGGTATTPDSLLGLRFKLEQKLTYIAKHMLGSPGGPTFLTIGSLEYDGYLKPNEARTASRILTLSEVEFESLSGSQQRTFLRDGAKLVDNIRARMLFALARSEARKADWEVQELPRKPRPDLVIEKGDRSYRVTTVFALSADSRFLRGPLKRLGALSDPVYTLKLIVVPHQSSASDRDVPAGMEIVTIDTFKKMLRDA